MPSIIARIYNAAFMVALISIAVLFAVRASAQEEILQEEILQEEILQEEMPNEKEIIKIGYSGLK